MAREDKSKDELVAILDTVGVQEATEKARIHGKAESIVDRLALEGEEPYSWLTLVLEATG